MISGDDNKAILNYNEVASFFQEKKSSGNNITLNTDNKDG
jgi:hypothetical protein